ncbi:MAG: hypothetical protein WAS51_14475 [Ilumatobacteraceae bacterium]
MSVRPDQSLLSAIGGGVKERLAAYLRAVRDREIETLVAAPSEEFLKVQGRVQMATEILRALGMEK